jgi:hypothetical protein
LEDEGGEHRDLIGSIAALLWVVFAFVLILVLRGDLNIRRHPLIGMSGRPQPRRRDRCAQIDLLWMQPSGGIAKDATSISAAVRVLARTDRWLLNVQVPSPALRFLDGPLPL